MSSRVTFRASFELLALAASMLACDAANAQWTVTKLQPESETTSFAYGLGPGHQVGSVGFPARAVMWTGTAASIVELHPAVASDSGAFDATDGQQVGYVHLIGDGQTHACLWTGTAESWLDLHPTFAEYSVAQATDDGIQVGYASFGNGVVHASLWSGSAASWTDLHPAQQFSSLLSGISEGKLVGSVTPLSGLQHAAYWLSPQSAWVDLHPVGAEFSAASGVRGDQQVGWTVTTDLQHAALWTGSAGSWIDLNPSWSTSSRARGTDGFRQVGQVGQGFANHACLWSGTADSAVDLHQFLPPGFRTSEATDIWSDSGTLFVVGTAQRDYPDAGYEAILWSRPLAPQDRCVDATRIAHWQETDGAAGDSLGESVAISGDTAVLGAPDDDSAAGTNSGSAYVYRNVNGVWSLEAKLVAADADSGDEFGTSVAIGGDTIVVGAPREDSGLGNNTGAVYVFTRAAGGTTWTQQARLVVADQAFDDRLGSSVSFSQARIAAGAPGDDDEGSDGGSAYVFVRTGGVSGTWSLEDKVTALDGAAGDVFGGAVSIYRDMLVVGAIGEDTGAFNLNRGAAYVFVESGGIWTQQRKLNASDAAINDVFGVSVSATLDRVIVGANAADLPGAINAGAAYVYVRSGITWTQQDKLTAQDAAGSDFFGSSVSLTDTRAVVGAAGADIPGGSGAGAAYVFARSGTDWTQDQKVLAADGAAGDTFGNSVALTGATFVVGAPLDTTPDGAGAGSGHVYAIGAESGEWAQQVKLVANGTPSQVTPYFGRSVELFGDTAVVAITNRGDSSASDFGVAYVYERTGSGVWIHVATLAPSDAALAGGFGTGIAMQEGMIAIGAASAETSPGLVSGAVYVFERSPTGVWSQTQRLVAPDRASGDAFGLSVDIDGETLVISAPSDDLDPPATNQGSVYVFTRGLRSEVWLFHEKLTASDAAQSHQFGSAVAISFETIVAGAFTHSTPEVSSSGAAYVFVLDSGGNDWTQQAQLLPPVPVVQGYFGVSVDVDRDTVIVGAVNAEDGGGPGGAAFVYGRSGDSWPLHQTLVPSDTLPGYQFGSSCAIDGDTLVVGDEWNFGPVGQYNGAVYVYARSAPGEPWFERVKLELSETTEIDLFGHDVAIFGNEILVSAQRDTVAGLENAGSVHLYRLDSSYSPAITTHPVSAAACITGQTSFSVAAAGTPPLTYQWQLETTPGSDVWINVTNGVMPGIGTFDISLPEVMVAVAITGGLSLTTRCVVTNDCGSTTSTEAALTLCAADFDCDGTRAVPDIFAFLSAWFAGNPTADIDGTPGVAVPDIFAFLSLWFAGCD